MHINMDEYNDAAYWIRKEQQLLRDAMVGPIEGAMREQQLLRDAMVGPIDDAMRDQQLLRDAMVGPIEDAMREQRVIVDEVKDMARQQENDKMAERYPDMRKIIENMAKPDIAAPAEKIKNIIELLKSIDSTLKEVLTELKSK